MGYPQAVTFGNQEPKPQQETVTSVLGNAFERLMEVERRLSDIREKIQARPSPLEKTAPPQVLPGTLHLSMDIRSSAVRLLERCGEIDSLL